jgi:hypothetical protein
VEGEEAVVRRPVAAAGLEPESTSDRVHIRKSGKARRPSRAVRESSRPILPRPVRLDLGISCGIAE